MADVDLSAFRCDDKRSKSETTEPEEAWPDPEPIPDNLPPVMAFDSLMLPGSLRPWIMDIAERMQCPPDFPAVGAMIALASLVGRKLAVRPKRHDDWTVVPNLWGAIIGPPSVMKSPPLKEVLKPLKRLVVGAQKAFKQAMLTYEHAASVEKLKRSALEAEIKAAMKARKNYDDLVGQMEALTAPERPARRRYVVNDTTVEKLQVLLQENPDGLLIQRDELIGFLRYLEREGQESARAFFLECWEGNGRHEVDRIGRGTVIVEAACLSIIGTIQPGPLGQYLQGAIEGGAGDDGLVQRFQLAVWPDIPKNWINVDRWSDHAAKTTGWNVFQTLDRLDPATFGAERDRFEPDGIPFLHFDPDTQDRFDAWMFERENRLRAGGEPPAIEAHLTKYRSLIPSLALIVHLAEGHRGYVGLPALDKAILWGTYLESHARRIYAQAIDTGTASAKALATRILAGDVRDRFAPRDVYRNHWSGLTSPEVVQTAVAYLADLDWLKEVREPTAGKLKTFYRINPKVHGLAGEGSDKSDKALGPETSGTFVTLSPTHMHEKPNEDTGTLGTFVTGQEGHIHENEWHQ